MDAYEGTCPLTQRQLIDDFFLEHRTKILDIAAFLDRLERSIEHDAEDDFRIVAFREALRFVSSGTPRRVEQIQMLLSYPVTELMAERDQQNAFGAFGGRKEAR